MNNIKNNYILASLPYSSAYQLFFFIFKQKQSRQLHNLLGQLHEKYETYKSTWCVQDFHHIHRCQSTKNPYLNHVLVFDMYLHTLVLTFSSIALAHKPQSN